jgi:hypothetical protein
MSTNLWPDFDSAQTPRSPKAVVEEAGRGLGKKTNGIVSFTQLGITSIQNGEVGVEFGRYTPVLNYTYPFLRLRFDIESMYPVTLITDK